MKRKVETKLVWVWDYVPGETGRPRSGKGTNLVESLLDNTQNVELLRVRAESADGGKEGTIILEFDRPFWTDWGPKSPGSLHEHAENWNAQRLIDDTGRGAHQLTSDKAFLHFLLTRRETSFCEAAIDRVIKMLISIGVHKQSIGFPKVTQQTFVWVRDPRSHSRGESGQWEEYGRFVGAKLGLIEPLPPQP